MSVLGRLKNAGYTGQYNTFGQQWRGANTALRTLKDNNVQDDDDYNAALSMLKNERANAAIGSSLSVMNGLSEIVPMTEGLARIGDLSYQQHQIDQVDDISRRNYYSFDDISDAYSGLNPNIDLSYDTVRGNTTKERVGTIGSEALSGATAGSVFGPWGAVIGGVVGGAAAGIGNAIGDDRASIERMTKRADLAVARNNAMLALNSQSENNADYIHRAKSNNVLASGGAVKRISVKDFANNIMNAKATNTINSAKLVKVHCKGGVMIRIKR